MPLQNSCLKSVGSGSCLTQKWHCDNGAQYGGGVLGAREGELCAREGGIEALCVQLVYY